MAVKSNGRTRLQKMVFLLDRCGADLGLNFTYHYYGPYSSDLTDGWLDAKAEDRIHVEEKIGGYGVPYSVFRLKKSRIRRKDLGNLEPEEAEAATQKMREVSNTVLELAATMVFLQEEVSARASHRGAEGPKTEQGDRPSHCEGRRLAEGSRPSSSRRGAESDAVKALAAMCHRLRSWPNVTLPSAELPLFLAS